MATEYLNNKILEASIVLFQKLKREKDKYQLIIDDNNQMMNKKKSKKFIEECKKINDEFKLISSEYAKAQQKLAMYFYELSDNIFNYAKFNFIDRDDVIQDGVMICFEKLDRFDPNFVGKDGKKAKAFNYLTTCILNSMRQSYRSSRNYNELKRKFTEFVESQSNSLIKNGREI